MIGFEMETGSQRDQRHGHDQHPAQEQHAPQPQNAEEAKGGVVNKHPGGKDALGQKENLLAPFYDQMQEVAHQLIAEFTPLGLHFRPEILLATAMQEAANHDPANARSFDNGLGIMQITP